jgi:hypothetical protein
MLKILGLVILVVFAGCISGLLFAFPIKWCWNYTIPYLFGLPVITWGKAWCLCFLSGCLIKSAGYK